MISVIVPVLNEAQNIKSILTGLLDNPDIEIIVIDGGSQDRTREVVRELRVKLAISERGRARQMNLGASLAKGDILLFLHADTKLPRHFEKSVIQTLSKPKVIAGAFSLKIDGQLRGIKLIESMVNWRSRFLQLPYGDQAIFITKENFQQVGGFPDLPIMEDFELILRLKKMGKIAIAPSYVITSARRWEKLGIWQTTFINQRIIMAYLLGIPVDKIATWYKQK